MSMHATDRLDLRRMLSIIAHRWYIVLLFTLLVAGAAVGYAKGVAKPVYESTALVTYQDPSRNDNPTGGTLPSTGITRENIQTLIGAAGRPDIVKSGAKAAGITGDELRRSVQVRPHGDASIIDFVARASTAQQAASYANSYAHAFVQDRRTAAVSHIDNQIKIQRRALAQFPKVMKTEDPRNLTRTTLEGQLTDLQTQRLQWASALQVSSEAQQPIDFIWPKTSLMLFVAVLVGFGLGSGVALLTGRADRRLHGDEWDELPAPVLVRVPNSRSAPRNAPMGPERADPQIADAFAALGARVLLDRSGEGAHIVIVSSARSGEGKSTVAANLAAGLAQGGRRVVLLDADMRRPTQAEIFPQLRSRPGLSQILMGATQVEHALTLAAPNLAAIGSGPRQSNASTLLASIAFRTLVERLTGICEVLVIDTPPVLAVADALAIAPHAQQVLLCARVGTSNTEEIEQAHARFAAAAPVEQAVVLVGTQRPSGYGYESDDLWPGSALPAGSPQPAAGAQPGSASGAVA